MASERPYLVKSLEANVPVVHQALHGYAHGHRMLATSLRLPKEADALLRIMSDISGPSGGAHFDPYYTGYPLVPGQIYAFACTWPAPEMSRPGCVWTHTLLVDRSVLSRPWTIPWLVEQFRRPEVGRFSVEQYSEPIHASEGLVEPEWDATQIAIEDLLQINAALYDSTDSQLPVVVAVSRFGDAARLFAAIWQMQWPSLRFEFTFCTGSIYPRRLGHQPFMLEASLFKDLRSASGRRSKAHILLLGDRASKQPPLWLSETVFAQSIGPKNAFYSFLVQMSEELSGDCGYFSILANAYVCFSTSRYSDAWSSVLNVLSQRYPRPDDASDLKSAFFGSNAAKRLSPFGVQDEDVLRAILNNAGTECLDPESLSLRERARTLWDVSPESSLNLLMAMSISLVDSPSRAAVCQGIADRIKSSQLGYLTHGNGLIAAKLVALNPAIVLEPEFWGDSHCSFELALTVVRESGLSREVYLQALVQAVVAAGIAPGAIAELCENEHGVILCLCRVLDAQPEIGESILELWHKFLFDRSHAIVDVLAQRLCCRIETAGLLLSAADAMQIGASSLGFKVANSLAPLFLDITATAGVRALVTCVSVALASRAADAPELACTSFDPVYAALERNAIPMWQLNRISELMPSRRWGREWDWCERLRLAIAAKIASGEWNATIVLRISAREDVIAAIVDGLGGSWVGRRALWGIRKSLLDRLRDSSVGRWVVDSLKDTDTE